MAANGANPAFNGRLGVQQRVLPAYRLAFFDCLAKACAGGLEVFAGEPRGGEAILTSTELRVARHRPARNRHLLAGPFYACWQVDLPQWLRSWDPQVLIVEANPRYLAIGQAVRWMHERNRPVLGWALGAPQASGLLHAPREAWRSRFVVQFDAMIAYSSQGAADYQRLGVPAERVFTAYNAVSPPLLPEAASSTRRSEMHDPLKVLSVGRLQARKRIDLLIQACAALALPLRLTVVGDGPARPQLEALARELLPEARFPGAVQGQELAALFEAADVFVLPGTGGLAVQQAMGHGLPVIVAEGDGTQRDLVTGDNGWLIASGDLPALESALRQAAADRERLKRLGNHSRQLVAERFNIHAMRDTFLEAIAAAQRHRERASA
jgi:glycosyltransferase involved in cell wall biosynthesis